MFVWFSPHRSPDSWLGDVYTHNDQAHFALLVGSVGSQDGDHHGYDAHDVQDDEARHPTLHLKAEETSDRFIFLGVFKT